MRIRTEAAADIVAIRAVNEAAFDTNSEANLVDVLRDQAWPIVSLVADDAGSIAGHILFFTVTLLGLAPMSVLPAQQRRGIGSALVLGHHEFYPRFGFVPASHFEIACEHEVPDEVFMAVELEPGIFRGCSGIIRYHPAFATV